MPSIRQRLLLGLLTSVLLFWACTALLTYRSAVEEVDEVFDANLSQTARVLWLLLRHEAEEKTGTQAKLQQLAVELGREAFQRSEVLRELAEEYLSGDASYDTDQLNLADLPLGHRYESKIVFRAYTDGDSVLLFSPNAPEFDHDAQGFSSQEIRGVRWRVYTLQPRGSALTVQVGEQDAIRDELINASLTAILWPAVFSLPLIGLIVWSVVGHGLAPLRQLAEQVQGRHPDSLAAVDVTDSRREIVPIVDALNRLFRRVHSALENERRFTSNAAHELRTPLAALKVHAQSMQLGEKNDKANREALSAIIDGADRATHLLEQLLAMARADSERAKQPLQRLVDLHDLVVEQIANLGRYALQKNINMALTVTGVAFPVMGDQVGLSVLVRNLLDNAIRYSSDDGRIEVRLEYQSTWVELQVCDDGPGIPEAQREQMFHRFERGQDKRELGSGLGLSIVHQVAELHGAQVQLGNGLDGRGLCVLVRLAHGESN